MKLSAAARFSNRSPKPLSMYFVRTLRPGCSGSSNQSSKDGWLPWKGLLGNLGQIALGEDLLQREEAPGRNLINDAIGRSVPKPCADVDIWVPAAVLNSCNRYTQAPCSHASGSRHTQKSKRTSRETQ